MTGNSRSHTAMNRIIRMIALQQSVSAKDRWEGVCVILDVDPNEFAAHLLNEQGADTNPIPDCNDDPEGYYNNLCDLLLSDLD